MSDFQMALAVFVLAFPFGFWRVKVPFKSKEWFMAIHIPVLFIIILRLMNRFYFQIPFSWFSLVFNFTAFFLAQWLAGVIYKRFTG